MTLLVFAIALSAGCKKQVVSHGTCSGSVGQTNISGPLSEQSAYELAWNDPSAPTLVSVNCGGKLILFAELKRTAESGKASWTIRSDDPVCLGGSRDGGTGSAPTVAPVCTAANGFGWRLISPKNRPYVATGSFEASVDEGHVLSGKADLRFEDGTTSTVSFALAYGKVESDFPRGVDVSGVPGRIDFSPQSQSP